MKKLFKIGVTTVILAVAAEAGFASTSLAFNLETSGITAVTANCTNANENFSQCGPQTFTVNENTITGSSDSPVTIYNNGNLACTVMVYAKKTCAHGGCGYQVYVDGTSSNSGYTCNASQYSHSVTLSNAAP